MDPKLSPQHNQNSIKKNSIIIRKYTRRFKSKYGYFKNVNKNVFQFFLIKNKQITVKHQIIHTKNVSKQMCL